MPAEVPTAPPSGAPDGQTPADAGDPAPVGQTPAAPSAPDPAGERQLAQAEQRATEHEERAGQLQAALDAVQRALNPDGGEAANDPAELAAAVADRDKQLDQVAVELRSAKVELAAYKTATAEGARADRLLNSRSFLDSVSGLDPDSPKFEQQLGEHIRAAVEGDPDLYRAGPSGPPKGGAEFNGPPAADKRPATLQDAVAARLSG